jgi:hypothetical protein
MMYDFVESVGFDDSSKWTERDRLQWERGCLAGLARAYGLVMSGKDPHPETGEAMVGLIKLIELENWITYQEEEITTLLPESNEEESE